jgi:TM2 domain-containing membrane protein YozV
MTNAPAGWYPQPDGSQRYWDGIQWSVHTSGADGRAVAPVVRSEVVPAAQPPMPPPAHSYAPPPPVQVAPKNPGLAVLASFFVPGLGQLVNGEGGKGVLFFLAYAVSIPLIFLFIGFVTAPIVWIWSMVDAYGGAQRWNARHGIVS